MKNRTALFLTILLLIASVAMTGCSSLPDFRQYVPKKIEMPKMPKMPKLTKKDKKADETKDGQESKDEVKANESQKDKAPKPKKEKTQKNTRKEPNKDSQKENIPATKKTTKKGNKPKRHTSDSPKQFASEQLRLSEKVLSGKWTIHSVSGKNVTGDDDQWPYIEFDVNTDKFYASNGCNLINGKFKVASGQQITMTDIIASLRSCPENEYPDINSQLSKVNAYSLTEHNGEYYLNLHNSKHITVMVLRKHNIDYLNGPWRVAEINGQKCQNPDVKLVIDIPEGLIHGNTGCNILNGHLYEDPVKTHSIQFHDIVTTRTVSSDVSIQATEMALLIALEDVEYAKPGSNGSVKLLDKRNHTLLILTPIRDN